MNNQVETGPHPDKIVITHGLRGWFAVHITWDKEFEGYEPWQSGEGSYPTKDDPGLIKEATAWAATEGILFDPNG